MRQPRMLIVPLFMKHYTRYTPKKSTKARGGLLLVFLSITVTFVGLLSFVSSFDQVERTLHAQNLGMISIFVGSVAATMACSAINKLFLHRCVPADKIAGLTMLWLGVTYTARRLSTDLSRDLKQLSLIHLAESFPD